MEYHRTGRQMGWEMAMAGKEEAPALETGAPSDSGTIVTQKRAVRAAKADAWAAYGAIMRARAEELGLGGREFAERMKEIGFEVSVSYLGKAMEGESVPSAENLLAANAVLWGDPFYAGAMMPLSIVLGLWRKR